jgi:peptidoglycan/xylan/chitin deacetylase (PgdA/CDA1 family)
MMDPLSARLWQGAGTARPPSIPILCYHATPRHHADVRSRFDVCGRVFKSHLDLLLDAGWQTLTLGELDGSKPPPQRSILITFDDGYANNLAGALEPLQARGMVATWFITTGALDTGNTLGTKPAFDHAMLASADVRTLREGSMAIGSHTVTHPNLSTLGTEAREHELRASRNRLEELLGEAVDSIAYPFGSHDSNTIAAAQDAGYRYGCTTRSGSNNAQTPRLELRRITVFRDDDAATLARKISLADNDASWNRVLRYGLGAIARKLRPSRG